VSRSRAGVPDPGPIALADASGFTDLVTFRALERAGYDTDTAVNLDGGRSFTL
jgi:hypothetical protein